MLEPWSPSLSLPSSWDYRSELPRRDMGRGSPHSTSSCFIRLLPPVNLLLLSLLTLLHSVSILYPFLSPLPLLLPLFSFQISCFFSRSPQYLLLLLSFFSPAVVWAPFRQGVSWLLPPNVLSSDGGHDLDMPRSPTAEHLNIVMRVWELSALWWWNSISSDPRCRCLLKAQPWLIAVWVAACCLQVSRFHMSERRDPAALCSNFAGIMVPKQRQPRGFSQCPGWTCFLAALDFFGFSDWNPRDRLDPPVLSCLSVNHKVWEHPLWGCLAWHIIYNFLGGLLFFPKCPFMLLVSLPFSQDKIYRLIFLVSEWLLLKHMNL